MGHLGVLDGGEKVIADGGVREKGHSNNPFTSRMAGFIRARHETITSTQGKSMRTYYLKHVSRNNRFVISNI